MTDFPTLTDMSLDSCHSRSLTFISINTRNDFPTLTAMHLDSQESMLDVYFYKHQD